MVTRINFHCDPVKLFRYAEHQLDLRWKEMHCSEMQGLATAFYFDAETAKKNGVSSMAEIAKENDLEFSFDEMAVALVVMDEYFGRDWLKLNARTHPRRTILLALGFRKWVKDWSTSGLNELDLIGGVVLALTRWHFVQYGRAPKTESERSLIFLQTLDSFQLSGSARTYILQTYGSRDRV